MHELGAAGVAEKIDVRGVQSQAVTGNGQGGDILRHAELSCPEPALKNSAHRHAGDRQKGSMVSAVRAAPTVPGVSRSMA